MTPSGAGSLRGNRGGEDDRRGKEWFGFHVKCARRFRLF
jgi:hypothetical protein